MGALIVTYHAVARPVTAISRPREHVERHLSALAEAGFTFVSLDDCADWLAGRRDLPERSAAVTFDDGYASVAVDGLPVLEKLGAPATMFVIVGRIGGDNQWQGQAAWVPRLPLVDAGVLGELAAAGMTIGSHSWSHARLPELSAEALRREVIDSGDRLEQRLQRAVRHFAYPYGAHGPREVAVARERYASAVSGGTRLATRGADPHDLPRLDAHDLHVAVRLRLVGTGGLPPYLTLRRSLRRILGSG